jgi:hypothetical protein
MVANRAAPSEPIACVTFAKEWSGTRISTLSMVLPLGTGVVDDPDIIVKFQINVR